MGLVGLRVDLCTFEGVKKGALPLLAPLRERKVRATFFPTLGPDRSGLAVLRVFTKKGFLSKMLRTRAPSMYGYRTLLHGTLLPAPYIASRLADVLRRVAGEGHELGAHAWDHVRWQDRIDRLDPAVLREDYERAVEAFDRAVGRPPRATAAPAWITNDAALAAARGLGFTYASDTRGRGPFRPLVGGSPSEIPQVPITLPTLDEVLGRAGATAATFAEQTFAGLDPAKANVLCIHAESEGRAHLPMFLHLLDRLLAAGWEVLPLEELLARKGGSDLPVCPVERSLVPGRAGEVSVQGPPRAG